jgi:hypothetical protein
MRYSQPVAIVRPAFRPKAWFGLFGLHKRIVYFWDAWQPGTTSLHTARERLAVLLQAPASRGTSYVRKWENIKICTPV